MNNEGVVFIKQLFVTWERVHKKLLDLLIGGPLGNDPVPQKNPFGEASTTKMSFFRP
jgi:hypothetical protein